jgi:hypothetical protein
VLLTQLLFALLSLLLLWFEIEIVRAGEVAQVVECLPRKHEVLSTTTSTAKKKKKIALS